MKKILPVVVSFMMVTSIIPFSKADAGSGIEVTINGKNVIFPDGKPFIDQNSRTMVPVRFVSQNLGYDVTWNEKEKEVTVKDGNKKITLTMNQKEIEVNGKKQKMDTEAKVVGGRTYVPIRFISQGLGSEINYDSKTKKVKIEKQEITVQNPASEPGVPISEIPVLDEATYKLELSRWGVYNDGTHAIETTKGINDAMKWAKNNGYKTLYIPSGTYLIAKGNKEDDRTDAASILLISDMKLQLDKNTVFQKETNGFETNAIITVLPGTKNASVIGGTLMGDRDTHDYSSKTKGGTHEWGHGIVLRGGDDITIDGVKIYKMTGDGIYVGMSPAWGAWEAKYGGTPRSTIELGSVDDNGNLVDEPGKVRNIGMLELREDTPEKYRMINVWIPQGLSSSKFDVFYYDKDKNFISKDSGITNAKYSKAPKEARYYRLVFSAPKLEGVYALMYHLDIANNVVIKNNDIGFNRRQGITAGGENVQILNNYIHDTKGTSPQSGIDIEPGFVTAYNHTIKGNKFENNVIQMVVSKGENLVVENNYFVKNKPNLGSGGFHIHSSYQNVKVLGNTFEGTGSGLSTEYSNSKSVLSNNTFINGADANISGYGFTFTKGNFIDSILQVNGYGYAQIPSYVTDTVIKSSGNNEKNGGIYIKGSIHLNNMEMVGTPSNPVTIDSQNALTSNTYQNFKVVNGITGNRGLASGLYKNNVSFSYTGEGTKGLGVQFGEKVTMDGVQFKNVTIGMHSIVPDGELHIKNSTFVFDGELSSTAIWAADGKNMTILNNKIYAKNASKTNIPIIAVGREGEDKYMHSVTIDGNEIHTKSDISAVDTKKAWGTTPVYKIQNNIIYNGKLNLSEKDINSNNTFLTE